MNEETESNHSNPYEGIFARQPDSVTHGVWSDREVYKQPLGPDVVVNRGWYGTAQVEESGFNW